ncbi:YraN family protein [bacterium]|nr:YraN family protein [bacterium]
MTNNGRNLVTGGRGEFEAVKFLEKLGYKIVCKNFRSGHGEIDIIAREHDTIVFVEVKSSNGLEFGNPEERVSMKKQRQIARIAERYIGSQNPDVEDYRFDVIAVVFQKSSVSIKHFKDAFWAQRY